MNIKKIQSSKFYKLILLLPFLVILMIYMAYAYKLGPNKWEAHGSAPGISFFREGNFNSPLFGDTKFTRGGILGTGHLFYLYAGLIFYLFGVHFFYLKLGVILIGLVIVFLVYKLTQFIYNRKIAYVTAFIFFLTPAFANACNYKARVFLAAATLTVLYYYMIHLRKPQNSHLFKLGFMVSLFANIHLEWIHTILAVITLLILDTVTGKKTVRHIIYFFAGAAVGSIVFIFFNIYLKGVDIFLYQLTRRNPASVMAFNMSVIRRYYTVTGFYVSKYLCLVLFVTAIGYYMKHNKLKGPVLRMLVFLLVLAVSNSYFGLPEGQDYILVLTPFFYLLWLPPVSGSAMKIIVLLKKKLNYQIVVALGILCFLAANYLYILFNRCYGRRNHSYAKYISQMSPYIPVGATVIGDATNWFGLSDRKYYAGQFYLSRLDEKEFRPISTDYKTASFAEKQKAFKLFLLKKNIGYIIYDRYFGKTLEDILEIKLEKLSYLQKLTSFKNPRYGDKYYISPPPTTKVFIVNRKMLELQRF